jgi:hypothetical protein
MTRKYSSISVETTLATGISNSATTMTVASGTGSALMGGVTLAPGNTDIFTVQYLVIHSRLFVLVLEHLLSHILAVLPSSTY